MEEFKKGDVIEGIVTSIKKYGVFLSFENNFIGLLHISEVSSKFINNLFNYFKIGDKIKVAVKTVDYEKKCVSVSIKELPTDLRNLSLQRDDTSMAKYIKDIDFSKLDKALNNMIKKELEKEDLENDKG